MMISLFQTVPIYSVGISLTGSKRGKVLVLNPDKVGVDAQGSGVIRKRLDDFGCDYLLVLSTVSQKDAIHKAHKAFQDHMSGKHIFKFEQFYEIVGED